MTLATRNTMQTLKERPSNGCAPCGDVLVAPKCSEHVSERSVRHLWGLRYVRLPVRDHNLFYVASRGSGC
jgi:hypothetical protein